MCKNTSVRFLFLINRILNYLSYDNCSKIINLFRDNDYLIILSAIPLADTSNLRTYNVYNKYIYTYIYIYTHTKLFLAYLSKTMQHRSNMDCYIII